MIGPRSKLAKFTYVLVVSLDVSDKFVIFMREFDRLCVHFYQFYSVAFPIM